LELNYRVATLARNTLYAAHEQALEALGVIGAADELRGRLVFVRALAQRHLATAPTAAQVKHARAYDPLSVDALLELAALEPDPASALQHLNDAVKLEHENAEAWYELGSFYAGYKQWLLAYNALNTSYTYDRFGPAAKKCGLLDQARTKAFHYTPPRLKNCPG
jgi:hypothetical protein